MASGISLGETTVGRELRALGYREISARPRHHARNELAIDDFRRGFPALLERVRKGLPAGTEMELWWRDEARVGRKNSITRRWARRGTRPRAPHDRRVKLAYVFGAIRLKKGKGAAPV